MTKRQKVDIYTDGACAGNPGPGGYGAILMCNGREKTISGYEPDTTNNRMELTAAIKGLSALKAPCEVRLFTDSRYLADAINNGWVFRWEQNGWMRNKKEAAQNIDLWEEMLVLLDKHRVVVVWVKGHADNPYNNRCDLLATGAIKAAAAQAQRQDGQ